MADTRILLHGLTEYRSALDRHLEQLQFDFQHLLLRWNHCNSVWDGDGADQFRDHWNITTDRFDYYLQRTRTIAQMLDERIEYLRDVNEPEEVLP